MTAAQIIEYGVPVNRWTSLSNFHQILFSNDGSLFPSDTEHFYIDSTNGLIFVKHLFPNKYLELAQNSNLASVAIENGEQILVFNGGVYDSSIGVFHDVYDLDEVTAIR